MPRRIRRDKPSIYDQKAIVNMLKRGQSLPTWVMDEYKRMLEESGAVVSPELQNL